MNYSSIENHCKAKAAVSASAIDRKIMYHAAARYGLDKKFDQELKKYPKVVKATDEAAINYMKAMYITKQIFGEKGLIHGYIEKGQLREYTDAEKTFLIEASQHAWKWSYAVIKENPSPNFFVMTDVFSDEEYLLYSPSMQNILVTERPEMWFNLIGFNGQCCQTFGMLYSFTSLTRNDIYYFATEVDRPVDTDQEILDIIDKTPIPFLLLYNFSRIPIVVSRDHVVRYFYSIEDCKEIPIDKFKKNFRISSHYPYLVMELLTHETFPHFARAIFNQDLEEIDLISMTSEGFHALQQALAAKGLLFSEAPQVIVSPEMKEIVKRILGREMDILMFSNIIEKAEAKHLLAQITKHPAKVDNEPDDTDDLEEATVAQINSFMGALIPIINTRKPVDIEALAKAHGLTIKDATKLYNHMKNIIG